MQWGEFLDVIHRYNKERLIMLGPVFKHAKHLVKAGLAVSFCVAAYSAQAQQQEIKIGVIYPLSGAAASTGAEMKDALELAADIITTGAKSAPTRPSSAGGVFPTRRAAKTRLLFAD